MRRPCIISRRVPVTGDKVDEAGVDIMTALMRRDAYRPGVASQRNRGE